MYYKIKVILHFEEKKILSSKYKVSFYGEIQLRFQKESFSLQKLFFLRKKKYYPRRPYPFSEYFWDIFLFTENQNF